MEANESINEVNLKKMDSQREWFLRSNTHGRESRITRNTTIKHHYVEELEMLLEAYFVQIDGTLNKLSTVCHSTLIMVPTKLYKKYSF